MKRSMFSVLLLGWLAMISYADEPGQVDDPPNVGVELEAILKQYPETTAIAERNAALTQLATKAEAAKSEEYAQLRRIYVLLKRPADILRMQRLLSEQLRTNSAEENLPKRPAPELSTPSKQASPKLPRPLPVPAGEQAPSAAEPSRSPASAADAVNRAKQKATAALKAVPTGTPESAPKFSVQTELNNIYRRFILVGPDRERNKADRTEALRQLAVKAEKEKSTEHAALTDLYASLERYDDAIREAREEIKLHPNDTAAQAALLEVLCRAKRTDEALAAFNRWIALDVAPTESEKYLAPLLAPFPGTVKKLITLLSDSGRYQEATQALKNLQSRVDNLVAKNVQPQTPPQAADKTINALQQNARVAINSLLLDISNLEQQSFNNASGPIKFADPLNVAHEIYRINMRFNAQSQVTKDPKSVEKAAAVRLEGLRQLVTAAEAAKSKEHLTLAGLYLDLGRIEDAVREAQEAKRADLADRRASEMLVRALCRLQLTDDAATEFHRRCSLEVLGPETDLIGFNQTTLVLARLYRESQQYRDAVRTLQEGQVYQTKLLEAFAKEKPIDAHDEAGRRRLAAEMRSELSSEVNLFMNRLLVDQPYLPIVAESWLNGPAMRPEQLKGRLVLIHFWTAPCEACLTTFPRLEAWQEKYGEKGLVIIGVLFRKGYTWNADEKRPEKSANLNAQQEDAAMKALLQHYGVKHRVAVATDPAISDKYIVPGLPEEVLVKPDGTIQTVSVGLGKENTEELERQICNALGVPFEPDKK